MKTSTKILIISFIWLPLCLLLLFIWGVDNVFAQDIFTFETPDYIAFKESGVNNWSYCYNNNNCVNLTGDYSNILDISYNIGSNNNGTDTFLPSGNSYNFTFSFNLYVDNPLDEHPRFFEFSVLTQSENS